MIKDTEEFCDIIDDMHDDWEVLQKDAEAGKHDCTWYNALVKYKPTGILYYLEWESSYNHGFDPCNTMKFPLTPPEAEIVSTSIKYNYKVKKKVAS